jgi:intein/homing endonuclease
MKTFPGIQTFINSNAKTAKSQGYLQNSYSGRTRHWNQFLLRERNIEFLYKTQSSNHCIQCLDPNSRVLTSSGYKNLIDILPEDKVWDGKNWTNCKLHKSDIKQVYKVSSCDSRVIKCSKDHRFLLNDGSWKRAENLASGDTLKRVTNPVIIEGNEIPEITQPDIDKINVRGGPGGGKFSKLIGTCSLEDTFWLMGLLIGDGSYNVARNTKCVVKHSEVEIKVKLEKILTQLVGTTWAKSVVEYNGKPSYYLYRIPAVISRYMYFYGLKPAIHFEKTIPESINTSKASYKIALLKGLFDSDGGITGTSTVGFHVDYTTVSEKLAREVSELLTSCGVANSCNRYSNGVRNRDAYRVKVVKSSMENFKNTIGFSDKRKSLLVDMSCAFRDLQEPMFKEVVEGIKLKSIEKTDEFIQMYDLEVFSEEHTFVVDWAYVHNSGAADCIKKAFLMMYEKLAKLGGHPCPPVHDEACAYVPIEHGNEALKILEECMIEGSQYWMKKVPMRAEGILGYTWRKEKALCDCCETEYEPKERLCHVYKDGDDYKIYCEECIKLKEASK